MVDEVIKAWDANNHKLKEWLRQTKQSEYQSYLRLLQKTVEFLFTEDMDGMPCHERVTEIDNGDYQGTLIFVIGGYGYQPCVSEHWYTSVSYGSCSGCDTLQGISNYEDYLPNDNQVNDYWTLCLHMIQRMKRME